jgi:hypothetical protein
LRGTHETLLLAMPRPSDQITAELRELVDPLRARGRLVGGHRLGGRDEPSWEPTACTCQEAKMPAG